MLKDNLPEDHNGKPISNGFSVEFVWNSVTFDRMIKGIRKFVNDHNSISLTLYETILGKRKDSPKQKLCYEQRLISHPSLPMLNEFQREAVEHALNNSITLIQGPPGTGKSLTIASIVLQLIQIKNNSRKKKTLVCAPSNNTVDHLTKMMDDLGIKVVRLYSKSRETIDTSFEYLTLHNQVKNLDIPKYDKLRRYFQLMGEIGELEQRDKNQFDQLYRSAERFILDKADVICCTCSAAFDARIENRYKFENVLIDEATQAVEPVCMLAMLNGARKVVIVGDNKQLGPVVISRRVANAGLKLSLYERLIKLGITPIRLLVQYRMHPELSMFSANRFYNGELRNGVIESERLLDMALEWPHPGKPIFFWNVRGYEEISPSGTSFINRLEVMKIDEIIVRLIKSGIKPSQIAVITTYKGQRGYLNQFFRKQGHLKQNVFKEIELGSVDSFQGREKDIIIISTVRSNDHSNVGFLSDYRRLNVALTRAKRGMIIIGNAQLLSHSKYWSMFLYDLKKRGLVFEGSEYNKLVPTNLDFNEPGIEDFNPELEENFLNLPNLGDITSNASFTLNNHDNLEISDIFSMPYRMSEMGFNLLPQQKAFIKTDRLLYNIEVEDSESLIEKLSVNDAPMDRDCDSKEDSFDEKLYEKDLMINLNFLNMDSDSDLE